MAAAIPVGAILHKTRRLENPPPSAPAGARSQEIAVSFITDPFDAEILIDGQVLRGPDGSPYQTPVTVPNLPVGEHDVVFRRADRPDLPAGRINFDTTGEIEARWEKVK